MNHLRHPYTTPDKSLRTLFNGALDQDDPAERARYLDDACGTDSDLRTRVECLLIAHEDAGGFFSDPSKSPAGFRSLLPITVAVTEKPGDSIGRYKLLQQIGEGGCGVVYMAEQEEPVRRRVALKVIKLGMDTRNVIARFEAERQALALMDHPNIARVLDAGATDTGRPYFVMELVRGIRITDYCDQNNLPTGPRLTLFTQVCQAIQHAHQKGIIHRDIKPSNILVTLHDGVPVPRVIDFGISKATTGERLTDKTIFTAFEQFIGTPAYMSPEQAEMSGLDIDTRSDIYALGVLLYELLTGQTPFDAKELLAAGLDAMRRTIREQEPPRPSTRLGTLVAADLSSVAKHRQSESGKLTNSISGDLDWIVMKALEKDRTRRYETATGLALDVQRHLNNEPVTARPPDSLYRFRKLVRRHQLAFAAAGAVAAALIIGLGVSTWMFFKEKEARERAVAAEQEQGRLRQVAVAAEKAQSEERIKAETAAGKSEQVARFLTDMLDGVGPSVAMGRDTKLLREILEETAERIGNDLQNQPEVEAEICRIIGKVYAELGEHANAEAMNTAALTLYRKLHGNEHLDVAVSLTDLASVLRRQGRLGEAETMHKDALAMTRKLLGNENVAVAASMNALACVFQDQGRLNEAGEMYEEALAMQRKLLGNENADVAASLTNLAGVLHKEHKLATAEEMYREALEMCRKLSGNDDPHVAIALNNMALVLAEQGNLTGAEAMYREALALYRKLMDNESVHVASTINGLAQVIDKQGRPAEAETMLREALAMQRKLLASEHIDTAKTLSGLGVTLSHQGKGSEAESFFREAAAISRKVLNHDPPALAQSIGNLANSLRDQRKYAESETLFQEALAMSRKLPDNEREVVRWLHFVGLVFQDQGKLAGAEVMQREALAISRELRDADLKLIPLLSKLALTLDKQEKWTEAEPLYREALEIARKTPGGSLDQRIYEMARNLCRQNKYAEAEPLYREVIESRQARLGPEHEDVLLPTAYLATLLADWAWTERGNLAEVRNLKPEVPARAREAERVLSEYLAIRLRGPNSNHWRTGGIRTRLGGALLTVAVTDPELTGKARQATLAEAEPLLLEGSEALQQSKEVDRIYQRDALVRLVRLYETWKKPDKAAECRRNLDEFDKAKAGTGPDGSELNSNSK